MDRQSHAAKIVILNGPSSAGKTTLARAVRDAWAPRAAAVSVDHFYACAADSHPNNWRLFAALTEVTFAAAAAWADNGFDVIVDTVFERADCLATAKAVLADRAHHLVAVTCALEVLEARELARADRRPGHAAGQAGRVLQNASYDLHLDTGLLSVEECVNQISALVGRRASAIS